MTQCQGMTRHGGVFTLGRPWWEQCKNEAVVLLKIKQKPGGWGHDITEGTFPACQACADKAEKEGIQVLKRIPIEHSAYVDMAANAIDEHEPTDKGRLTI